MGFCGVLWGFVGFCGVLWGFGENRLLKVWLLPASFRFAKAKLEFPFCKGETQALLCRSEIMLVLRKSETAAIVSVCVCVCGGVAGLRRAAVC